MIGGGAAMGMLALGAPLWAKPPRVGDLAPDATMLLAKSGKYVRLSDLHGQVIVLNFWATWCGPCKQELPLLDSYYTAMKQYGLRVFAATTEDSLPLSVLHQLFDVLAIDPVRRLHGPYAPINNSVPTNFVIDRAGRIRYAAAGAFNLDMLNTLLVPILNERAPEEVKTV